MESPELFSGLVLPAPTPSPPSPFWQAQPGSDNCQTSLSCLKATNKEAAQSEQPATCLSDLRRIGGDEPRPTSQKMGLEEGSGVQVCLAPVLRKTGPEEKDPLSGLCWWGCGSFQYACPRKPNSEYIYFVHEDFHFTVFFSPFFLPSFSVLPSLPLPPSSVPLSSLPSFPLFLCLFLLLQLPIRELISL